MDGLVEKSGDGTDFWNAIQKLLGTVFKASSGGNACMGFLYEIVIGLLYPKIDAHVSAQTNHLLKCPFNIHSGSGLISIPLDDVKGFNIELCPTVQQILQNRRLLEPYMKTFQEFLDKLNGNKKIEGMAYQALKREKNERTMEF